jgi:poly(A) polymerase
MKIVADWLQAPPLQRLLAAFSRQGYVCYIVGGAVRNALMGRPVGDIDLASNALPDMVSTIAGGAGFRAVPTGLAHGTITLIKDGHVYEVTTFRRDAATDGRRAQVVFTDDLAQDAQRRDFTINALYADAQGHIFDPVGGLDDIATATLRFVGDPDARITEDYLRILRYFRFCAHYANPVHGFDPAAMAACAAHLDGLDQLSRERIGMEMRKILSAPNPALALSAMAAIGVLPRVLPGADPRAIAPLVHIEDGTPSRWTARLAALGAQDARDALRLSRAEATEVQHLRQEIATGSTAAALAWKYGKSLAKEVLLLRAAMAGQALPAEWQAALDFGAQAVCPVSAADFIPHLSGPALGKALSTAVQSWLDSDLRATKADLLQP